MKLTWTIIFVLAIQLIYGGLMAGHKAAVFAPTWPDINGYWIPPKMFPAPAGLLNLLENKITVHFIHRTLAYLIFVLMLFWTWKAFRPNLSTLFQKTKWLPLFFTLIQVALGVFAVFASVEVVPGHWGLFEWMAQLHQLTAMFLLLILTGMAYLLKSK